MQGRYDKEEGNEQPERIQNYRYAFVGEEGEALEDQHYAQSKCHIPREDKASAYDGCYCILDLVQHSILTECPAREQHRNDEKEYAEADEDKGCCQS